MTTAVIKLKISDNVERPTAPRILVQEVDGSVGYVAKDSIGGSGIGGTQYSYVAGKGTPTENATELQNAYNLAKTIVGLSATNRFKIIVGTGKYEFTGQFTIDTQYIDFVSLTGDADVEFPNGINVTANDVYLKGLKTSLSFEIATNLNLLVCENCVGGNNSFGNGIGFTASGTFTNCTGVGYSFGGNGCTASGTFTNCTGGYGSFGGNSGTASGTFTNCTGGFGSFGVNGGTASGTFTNCTGVGYSFGGNSGTASGTFTNCTGGFGSFGGGGTASGTFTNCVGGNSSFGGGAGALTGKLFYCRLTAGLFPTVSSGGRTYYCVDGNGNTNNQ